jgi:cytochrome c biogenesis protein
MRSEMQEKMSPGARDPRPETAGSPLLHGLRLLWRVLVHPVTFVVITIMWCVDLAAGSIAAYFNDPQFWQKMDAYPFNLWMKQVAPKTFPGSLWVYILVVLSYVMVLSLLLCTINWFGKRRKYLKRYGEVLVHLGFLFIFVGFVLGSSLGTRTRVVLETGQVVPVEEMGISLRLNGLEVVQSPGGRPMDTLSEMTVLEGNREVAAGTIRTNHPLIHGSTVIYPPEDYDHGVVGGVVGTSSSGAVTLRKGVPAPLADGRTLWLGGVLQEGQRRGSVMGPGILVQLKDASGQVTGSAFLSAAPGMSSSTVLGGERLTLGQLVRSARGVYRIHHDPGVWLVILGTIILALGTVWALAGYLGLIRDPEKIAGSIQSEAQSAKSEA